MKNYQLQFKGHSIQMEIDFNVKNVIDQINESKIIKTYTGRRRKWKENQIMNEIVKYNTLKEFRKQRPHLWVIYKHLVLLPLFSKN